MAQENDNAKPLELIDSHCHLDFPEFDENREALINECAAKGVKKFIVPGVTADTWSRLKKVANDYSSIYPAYGLHPYFLAEHKLEHVEALKVFIQNNPSIAIGEIGLDYYLKNLDRNFQQKLLLAQLALANELNLPVILHVRKAHDDVLSFLKQFSLVGGTVHAFNGSFQQAEQYLKLGFKLGFGGAMTFERARHLRQLVSDLPLEAIVLETDAPDMRPANYSQEINTPLTVLTVFRQICKLRRETPQQIANQMTANTCAIFSLPN